MMAFLSQAIGRRGSWRTSTPFRTAAHGALLATLVLLPFEYRLPEIMLGPLTMTTPELVWIAAIGAWVLSLVAERRLPPVPRTTFAAVAVLLIGGVISAVLALGYNSEALRFVGRTGAGCLLLVATFDMVRSPGAARRVAAAVAVGLVVAATAGLVVYVVGPIYPLSILARDEFVVAGVPRLQATFDYPNTAAMALEAGLMVVLGLCGSVASRRWRVGLAAGSVVIAVAMLLTFSRGATVGALAGLGVVALLSWRVRRPRTAVAAALCGLGIVIGTLVLQFAALPSDRLLAEGNDTFYGAVYRAPATVVAAPDQQLEISIAITNTGTLIWNRSRPGAVVLGYRWLDPTTMSLLRDGEEFFEPGVARPNETVTATVWLRAPSTPGEYLLGWDMLAEHVGWFSDRGHRIATSRLLVGVTPTEPPAVTPTEPPGGPPTITVRPEINEQPARFDLWRAAIAMAAERPVFGAGPGTFRLRYGQYLGWETWDTAIHANNLYLEILATTGLVGLASLAVVVGVPLRELLRRLMRPTNAAAVAGRSWHLRVFVLGALVAFLAHGFVDYFLAFYPTAGLFWSLLGLALGLALRVSDE